MQETLPKDTTREALAVQLRAWERMGEAGRLRLVSQLCRWHRSLVEAGIRQRHPEYTDEQVRLAGIRVALGEKLFAQVHPGVEVAA